jgi:hypothetical protein
MTRLLFSCAAAIAVAGFVVFSLGAMAAYFILDREVRDNVRQIHARN